MSAFEEMFGDYLNAYKNTSQYRDNSMLDIALRKSEFEKNLDEMWAIYSRGCTQQIIELHEGMNASASSSESDHMLERVREGAKKTRERAAGAQIAYDTSAKAQDRRLEAQARNREADELLAEMKRKRGNN